MRIAVAQFRHPIREALRRPLALRPGHEIIWIARSGTEALERCAKARPDLLLMELTLPGIDAIEATRRIMTATPCAILIVACGVSSHASAIFHAMGHGALDAVDILTVNRHSLAGAVEFRKRIDSVAALLATAQGIPGVESPEGASLETPLIAIGASAGGPAALASILKILPADFPAALVIAQHIQPRLAASMAEWLRGQSRVHVRIAGENDTPEPGTALLASPNGHLKLKRPDRVGYTFDPHIGYLPCIDVLFQSVSALWPGKAAGVLLTGIGWDGAAGLRAMRARGHHTIAQDRATSVVYGMPGAARAAGAAVDVLPLEHIAERLIELFGAGTRREMRASAAAALTIRVTE